MEEKKEKERKKKSPQFEKEKGKERIEERLLFVGEEWKGKWVSKLSYASHLNECVNGMMETGEYDEHLNECDRHFRI